MEEEKTVIGVEIKYPLNELVPAVVLNDEKEI